MHRPVKRKNILVAVDNTFVSPYLQNPLDLWLMLSCILSPNIRAVILDDVMRALIMNDEKLYQELHFIMNSCGAVPGPQDSSLVLRGIKTLHLRMERHCFNGKLIAEYLKSHPRVGKVFWPGFSDHPNHDIAKKQMKEFEGMLSFTL